MPIKKLLAFLLIVSLSLAAKAQAIKSPETFLSFRQGNRFVYTFEVNAYCQYLVSEFPQRFRKIDYGVSPEGRPLFVVIRSSAENLARLEEIRQAHQKNEPDQKLIQWLSFNIHGDEAAGTETALQLLYELAMTDEYLDQITIIDPCVNPDGRERFVSRINPLLNNLEKYDPRDLSHTQPWPQGRYNHYLADLNRDWCWAVQPETRQRIKLFGAWNPHIHADFHEMEPERTYFFPPPSEPIHELIPGPPLSNIKIIGQDLETLFRYRHWKFFTGTEFDLLYPGYGDTYSIFTGSLGLTLEQGGSAEAGILYIKANGDSLTLKSRIERHLQAAFSILQTAEKNKTRFIRDHITFQKTTVQPAAYVIKNQNHAYRNELIDFLERNLIEFRFLKDSTLISASKLPENIPDGIHAFTPGDILIDLSQKKSLLIQSLFEARLSGFAMKTYDISYWPVSLLFHADAYKIDLADPLKTTERDPQKLFRATENERIYAFEYNSLAAAKLLSKALQEDLKVYLKKDKTNTLYISPKTDGEALPGWLNATGNLKGWYLSRGEWSQLKTRRGLQEIKNPTVALVYDERCEESALGDYLVFLEQNIKLPFSLISLETFTKGEIDNYTTVLVSDGYFRDLDINEDKIKRWIADGGRLILSDGAMEIAQQLRIDELPRKNLDDIYYSKNRNEPENLIQGCMFEVNMNPSSLLSAGLKETSYLIFTEIPRFEPRFAPTDSPALTHASLLKGGYAGKKALSFMDNSFVLGTHHFGDGMVIQSAVNLLFRNIQMDGQLMMSNALLMPAR